MDNLEKWLLDFSLIVIPIVVLTLVGTLLFT